MDKKESWTSFENKVQSTKFSSFDDLEINTVKPLDTNRYDKKIVFVSQTPSTNREQGSKKIFEGNNPSDLVFQVLLSKLRLTRDEVYVTNLVKSSVDDMDKLTKEELKNYQELFYEEMNIIKPLLIVFMSDYAFKNIDLNRIRCPVIKGKHPAYFFRQTGDATKAGELMYKEILDSVVYSVTGSLLYKYNIYIDYTTKTISFKCEGDFINYVSKINNMKLVNISVDSNYTPVVTFISNKINFYIGFKYHNYCWIECPENECEKRSIKGEPCKKLEYFSYKDLPQDIKVYEKDIHQDYRFIIDYADYFETVKKEELRYMTFDIETNKSVDIINTPGEIISIVYLLDGKYEFLFLDNKNNNYSEFKNMLDIKVYEKEKDMLEYFINIFKSCNIVTGFNIWSFDILYLMNRASKLGIPNSSFSPIERVSNGVVEEKDRMNASRLVKIHGLDIIDSMMYAKEKHFVYALDKPSQMNLDYLGNFIKDKDGKPLGSKLHSSMGPADQWMKAPMDLYLYNIQDVKLCRDIEDYMRMTDFLLSFKNLMSTFNISWSLANSKIIDFLILCRYKDKCVFPSKHENTDEELTGGYVKDPISGLYKNVAVFDFASLYPNIIRNFNISYETLSSNKNEYKNYIDIYDEVAKEHIYINKDKTGLFAEITEEIMKMKKQYGDALKEGKDPLAFTKYNAIKAVINSIYGVAAYRYFRMYDIRLARAITAAGRKLTKSVVSYIDSSKDYISLGADTDSCFIHNKKPMSYDEAMKDFFILIKEVNKQVSNEIVSSFGVPNKHIEMECETIFDRFLQTQAKKKYFGIGKYIKGKLYEVEKDYNRGTDLVKKDTPVSLRPILKKLLISIVKSDRDEQIKQAIKDCKSEMSKLSYRELLITKQMSRELDEYKVVPQHIRAFIASNKYLSTSFSRASYKGGMLHVIPNAKYGQTEVIMLNEDVILPEDLLLNREKYFDLFVKNKLCLFAPKFEKFFSKNHSLNDFLAAK